MTLLAKVTGSSPKLRGESHLLAFHATFSPLSVITYGAANIHCEVMINAFIHYISELHILWFNWDYERVTRLHRLTY
jgi:hypothetical protein